MSKKTYLSNIAPYVELHRCPRTGIAWVEDGTTGNGHSAHPNIDITGSVRGMKNNGFWGKKDKTIRTNGYIYNISKVVVCSEYDEIAKSNCRCEKCETKYKNMYTKEKAVQNALNEASSKNAQGLLIACNDENYEELMEDPCTDEGDRETVYSIASLYSNDENNDGTWEDAILNKLKEDFKTFF